MADSVSFDFHELNVLSADLGEVVQNVGPNLRAALMVTSVNVKKAAQRKVSRRKHFKQAAASIDFEVKTLQAFGVSVIQSEIGYSKERGGASDLGNLIEFGAPGSPNALTPGNELQTALQDNMTDFVRGLAIATAQAEREAGL